MFGLTNYGYYLSDFSSWTLSYVLLLFKFQLETNHIFNCAFRRLHQKATRYSALKNWWNKVSHSSIPIWQASPCPKRHLVHLINSNYQRLRVPKVFAGAAHQVLEHAPNSPPKIHHPPSHSTNTREDSINEAHSPPPCFSRSYRRIDLLKLNYLTAGGF